jgi:hypothetical protein
MMTTDFASHEKQNFNVKEYTLRPTRNGNGTRLKFGQILVAKQKLIEKSQYK